jgi:hypothetical protein
VQKEVLNLLLLLLLHQMVQPGSPMYVLAGQSTPAGKASEHRRVILVGTL